VHSSIFLLQGRHWLFLGEAAARESKPRLRMARENFMAVVNGGPITDDDV